MKFLVYERKYWPRMLLHLPIGLVNCFLCWLGWVYGLTFAAGFLTYEVSEDWRIHDRAFPDISGWLWGLAVDGVILLILKLIGIA